MIILQAAISGYAAGLPPRPAASVDALFSPLYPLFFSLGTALLYPLTAGPLLLPFSLSPAGFFPCHPEINDHHPEKEKHP